MLATFSKGIKETQENNEDASNPKKKVVWQDNLNL